MTISDKEILRLIERFGRDSISGGFLGRVHGGAHDAVIGAWIHWWIRNVPESLVLNPGAAAVYRKERRYTDILFAERGKLIGAAEIENSEKHARLLSKVRSLRKYEKVKKFSRDLRFLLLCAFIFTDEKGEPEKNLRTTNVEATIGHVREASAKSNILWVAYVLKWVKQNHEDFVTLSKRAQGYRYLCQAADWHVFKNGCKLSKGNWSKSTLN